MAPSAAMPQTTSEAQIMTGTSMRTSCGATASGAISPAAPRMKSTLKTLEPTTLPTARSGLPSSPEQEKLAAARAAAAERVQALYRRWESLEAVAGS